MCAMKSSTQRWAILGCSLLALGACSSSSGEDEGLLSQVGNAASGTVEAVGNAAGAAVGAVGSAAGATVDAVGNVAEGAVNAVTGGGEAAAGQATTIVTADGPCYLIDGSADRVVDSNGTLVLAGGNNCDVVTEVVPQPVVESEPEVVVEETVVVEPTTVVGVVYFALDSDQLGGSDKAVLDDVIGSLEGAKAGSVSVRGYADPSGTAAYNQALSTRRAQNVAAYLEKNGIEAVAWSVEGEGEDASLAPAEARRVEIRIESDS